jgi:hypothetical protein
MEPMAVQPIPGVDIYTPRAAWFERVTASGQARIKLYFISMDGITPGAATVKAAIRIISGAGIQIESTPHRHAGFAILHRDDEANWLTLQWWMEAGTVGHLLWRAEAGEGADFHAVADPLTACVWELGVVDFERRAWMETAMAQGSIEQYLARTFPRGTV